MAKKRDTHARNRRSPRNALIIAIVIAAAVISMALAYTQSYSFASYEGACKVQLNGQSLSALINGYLQKQPAPSNQASSQFQGGPCHIFSMNESIPSFNITVNGMVIGQPVVYRGTLLVPLSGQKNTSLLNTTWGAVEAFNTSTGAASWYDRFNDFVMTQPIIVGNTAYVGTGTDFVNFSAPPINNVAALNITTGAVLWKRSTLEENKPTFIYFNNSLIKLPGLGGTGNMTAYNLSSGKILWQLGLGGYSAEGSPPLVGDIAYVGLRNIMEPSTPGATSSNLYAPAPIHNSSFLAVDLLTHKIIWSRTFNASLGMQDTSPSVWGDVVVSGYAVPITPVRKATSPFISPKYNISVYIVGINASDGRLLWTFNMGSGMVSSNIEVDPTSAYNDVVYADAVSTGVLYAINMTTGKELWSVRTGPAIGDVNIVDGYAILSNDSRGTVFVIDASNGTVKEKINMNMGSLADVAQVGNSLLFSSFHIKTMTGGVESVPISQVINNTISHVAPASNPIPPSTQPTPSASATTTIQSAGGAANQSVYCASCYN